MIERGDGEGEERKEIEARLHFAGISRSRLARIGLGQRHVIRQARPTSILTIRLTCLSSPLLLPLLPPHNGIRSLFDAFGYWTLRGLDHEVHGPAHLHLVFAAIRCEGVNTPGHSGARKYAPGTSATYVNMARRL